MVLHFKTENLPQRNMWEANTADYRLIFSLRFMPKSTADYCA